MSFEQKPEGSEGVSCVDIAGEEHSSRRIASAKTLRQRGFSWRNTRDRDKSKQGQRSIGSGSGYESDSALRPFEFL